MKRILVFGMTTNAGGVESVIMNYYRSIDKNQVQFDFLCNSDSIAYYDEIIKMKGNVYFITPASKNFFKYKKEIKNFFKKNSYKYETIWMNVCALSNIDYLKYSKKYGIKKRIIHSHNSQSIESKVKRIFHNINKKIIFRYATEFWACSYEAGKFFYGNNDFKIINNAINLEKFKFNFDTRKKYRKILNIENKFVIGNVARFHFQKNHIFLINVFNEIIKINPDSILLLIGDGEDLVKVKKYVEELNLNSNVLFLGKRSDIDNLYQAMDVFVLPSLFEGLPVVLIEAQANGLPIVSSSEGIPSTAKIVENFEFISLNESVTKWANQILNVKKENKSLENIKKLKSKGYDIQLESKKIMEILK